MSDETRDFDEAHLAYTRQRHADITAGAREKLTALGESIGVPDLTPEDDLQPDDLRRMVRNLAETIRAEGHGDLADRWELMHAVHDRAMQEQERLLALRLERPLTESEDQQAAAADTVAHEATEQLEGIQGAVDALFTRPPNGDA